MRYFMEFLVLVLSIPAYCQEIRTEQQSIEQRQRSTEEQRSPDVQNYAPYSIALLPADAGAEVVLPFLTTDNKLVFFPLSQVQQASTEKRVLGRLISYGELISLIGDLQIQVNQ